MLNSLILGSNSGNLSLLGQHCMALCVGTYKAALLIFKLVGVDLCRVATILLFTYYYIEEDVGIYHLKHN